MNKNKITNCSLCLQFDELQRSHYFPKAMFKELAKGVAQDLPAPLLIDLSTNRSVVTNNQPTAYLLCSNCEGKFDKQGERIVLPQMRKQNVFPLRDEILVGLEFARSHEVESIDTLNGYAYAYFALSIVWRGSVHDWKPPYHLFNGLLGPYEETFRQWLSGEGKFPAKTRVEILVDSGESPTTFGGPNIIEETELGRMRAYQFLALGVWFKIYVGGYLNEIGRDAFYGGQIPIAFRKVSFERLGIDKFASEDFAKTEKVGKFEEIYKKRMQSKS